MKLKDACLACTKKNYNKSSTEIAENVTNEIEKLRVSYLLTDLKESFHKTANGSHSTLSDFAETLSKWVF